MMAAPSAALQSRFESLIAPECPTESSTRHGSSKKINRGECSQSSHAMTASAFIPRDNSFPPSLPPAIFWSALSAISTLQQRLRRFLVIRHLVNPRRERRGAVFPGQVFEQPRFIGEKGKLFFVGFDGPSFRFVAADADHPPLGRWITSRQRSVVVLPSPFVPPAPHLPRLQPLSTVHSRPRSPVQFGQPLATSIINF